MAMPQATDALASLAHLAAIGALFLGWKRRDRLLAGLAILLALAGTASWMAGHGPEYGLVYSGLMLMFLGWSVVFLNRDFRVMVNLARPWRALRRPGPDRIGQALFMLVLAGPGAGLAGFLAGLGWTVLIPGEPASRIVSGLLVWLLGWALLACWLLGASRWHRPAVTSTGLPSWRVLGCGQTLLGFSLPSRTQMVRQALQAHSALGLAMAALLYVTCLTGTLAVFEQDVARWEQPGVPERLEVAPQRLQHAVQAVLARLGTAPDTLVLDLPTPEMPRLRIHWRGAAAAWYVRPDGSLGEPMATPWSDLVRALHVRLLLPETWGVVLVGILGVMLVALLVSGVLAHPSLARDAFRWRSGATGRLFHVDLHNRLGVWGLPFSAMIALSGAFLGLAGAYYAGYAALYHQHHREEVHALVYGADITPHGPADAPLDLGAALQGLHIRAPSARPLAIMLNHLHTPRQHVEIAATLPGRLVYAEIYRFTVAGHFIGHQALADGPPGRQLAYSAYRLHFGWFGGWPVRVAFMLLGLGMTILCASGVNAWLAKRPQQTLLDTAWVAWVWGWPLGLAGAALAALHGLAPWPGLLGALLLAMGLTGLVRHALILRQMLVGALGGMLLAVMLSHLMYVRLLAVNPASLTMDVTLGMAAAGVGLWVLRR